MEALSIGIALMLINEIQRFLSEIEFNIFTVFCFFLEIKFLMNSGSKTLPKGLT